MAGVKTNFWGWDSPLIQKAVAELSGRTRGRHAIDLSDTLIIVPTAESSRRLREALAVEAATRDAAVMAPWVWHPEQCLLPEEDRRRTATATQCLLAWVRVLQEGDLARLTKLFPSLPERRSIRWMSGMARTFIDLQSALGAAGLQFADVAASEHAEADRERWVELTVLERAFEKVIGAMSRIPPQRMKRERALAPVLPPEGRRVVVIGVADAPPLFNRWLTNAAAACEVSVVVQAPKQAASGFSATGRPLGTHWGERADVIVPIDDAQLHIECDPAAQARKAEDLLPGLLVLGRTAVGVCDAETAAHLQDLLAAEDVRAYEPGGTSAGLHAFMQLATLWMDLVQTSSWKTFAALLRIPEFARLFAISDWEAGRLLRLADDFADARLPADLDSALTLLSHPEDDHQRTRLDALRAALEQTIGSVADFKSQPLPAAIRTLMVRLYGGQPFRVTDPHEGALMELTTAWIQIADALATDAALTGARLDGADALALSVELLADKQLSDPRGDVDLVIQGWLELLWEPAENLVVLGCNEESLPGIFISHPFLPDRLRQALGLPCQATRYARDAYLLKAIASQRAASGALHLLCGQWSERGDALRPSRLLFLCEDKTLSQRVNHLFPKHGAESAMRQPPRTWSWKLKPRAVAATKTDTISVSRLNAYLSCPFRFYLSRELHMDSVDPGKAEMSPGEFGNLIHAAFKALADAEPMRDCVDETKLAAFLCDVTARECARLYGPCLPFPVRLQLESAVQRLHAAASVEAAHRAQGWRTQHAEFGIGGEDDAQPLIIGTRKLVGTIDRIDQRGDEILILDFKTRETAVPPTEAHLTKLSAAKAATAEEWLLHCNADGKTCAWTDLQLPLYVRAWALRHAGPIHAGYFHLPTNVQDTGIALWDELDDNALQSALSCATQTVARIDQRIHWPPNEDVKYDDYESLFAGYPVEEVVDATVLIAQQKEAAR